MDVRGSTSETEQENGYTTLALRDEVSETKPVAIDEEDIWALPELQIDFTPWSELSTGERLRRVFLHFILKIVVLIGALYIFICSLTVLGDAFQLLGGKAAGKTFTDNEILANPIAGVMIGLLATVLFQSSSTTTSIIVSMVGSGDLLTVRHAIPIVMGANIGTSITNTIVSLGQIADKDDFRRAFAGATVHDAFNWLTVLVLLPLELVTGYLEHVSEFIVKKIPESSETQGMHKAYLTEITDPFTSLIIQIDKSVIEKIAAGDKSYLNKSIIKHSCCVQQNNGTNTTCKTCTFLFEKISRDGNWSDAAVGGVLLVIALVLLCVCLVLIVKLLHSLLRGQIAHVIRKFINADFPGKWSYFTGYLAIMIGVAFTVLVQSSSVFTSSLTPLVGIGVLSLDRMYPLTLGSNIGTTTTGILAAFAQDGNKIRNSLQIALCHMFFNISGLVIFYPLPFFRPPIEMAKFLGVQTSKYRWFSIVYLLLTFFLLPVVVFGLSVASWVALAAVFIPISTLVFLVLLIKLLQNKRPHFLPPKLRNWKWLPLPLRSLEPYDRALMKVTGNCFCCKKLGCLKAMTEDSDDTGQEQQSVDSRNDIHGVELGDILDETNIRVCNNEAHETRSDNNTCQSTIL